MEKVAFKALWDNYPDSNPCDKKFKNQCAIKVGATLAKSGITTTNLVTVKRHCWFHDKSEGHVLSAQDLAKGLIENKIYGIDDGIELPGVDFETKITGKKGIIFFQNYWLRNDDAQERPTGDHIDLWNGSRLTDWSSWIRIQLGLVIPDVWSDLEKSSKVMFWNIPQ